MSIQSACQKTKACMLLSFWTTNVTWLAGSSSLAVVGSWTAAAMTRSNMRTTYMTFVYKLCATTLLSIWCWQELWAQFMWETILALHLLPLPACGTAQCSRCWLVTSAIFTTVCEVGEMKYSVSPGLVGASCFGVILSRPSLTRVAKLCLCQKPNFLTL